ncbi:MAG: hemoglobin [Planctomycetota bacterium]|jgi:hemoglobin
MTQSIYEKIGGAANVSNVVTDFYERLLADKSVSDYFADVDIPELISHQTNFVSRALGGPEIYEGRDLSQAHAGRGITSAIFATVVQHLKDSLLDAGVSEEDTKVVTELVASLEGQIVGIPSSKAG